VATSVAPSASGTLHLLGAADAAGNTKYPDRPVGATKEADHAVQRSAGGAAAGRHGRLGIPEGEWPRGLPG